MDLQQLLDKRAKLLKEWKAFLEQNKDGLSAEAKEKSDKMSADIDALDAQIEATRKMAELEAKLNEPVSKPLAGEGTEKGVKASEYTQAFESFIKGHVTPEIKAVLNTGVGSEGGYIVPEEYQRKIVQKLTEISRTRAISTVITTASTRNIPVGGEIPQFVWVDENGTYGEAGTNFGKAQLGAYKLGSIIRISEELLQETMIDLEVYLTDLIARGIEQAEGAAFATGDGTGKPTGYSTLTASVTLASNSAITADEIIDIFYSLKAPYRTNATWRLNDEVMKSIRKLKDGNGNYIYAPALVNGERDQILGRPIEIDPNLPGFGANNKIITIGDFSYYYIADRGRMEIQRLNEAFAVNGQVGFKINTRVDAKPVLDEAFSIAQCPA